MEFPKGFDDKKFELVLDATPTSTESIVAKKDQVSEALTGLDEEEQRIVTEFSKKIDIENPEQVLNYGVEAQKKLDTFSEKVLLEAKTKDLGETGDLIGKVVLELSEFSTEQPKGILGFFKKTAAYAKNLKIKYDSVEKNVDNISAELRTHQQELLKDHAVLESLYEQNREYYKELSLYIAAGKIALSEARVKAEELQLEAARLGTQEAAQRYSDYVSQCDRFEKKLYDLETTRVISIQMAPQIRMLQANNYSLIEKIQSTIVNTIPLWKSQLVITLGTQTSLKAAEVQKQVSDLTNELLRKNAEALHMASVSTAKELERGIVDIDTLKYTNQELMTTLKEVMQIQSEGRSKRAQAEVELIALEQELRDTIMSLGRENGRTKPISESAIKLELK